MKIVVDTNIVFSAVLNSQSTIGDIIMNSEGIFEFVSALYLKEEIENHKGRLIEISGLSSDQIKDSIDQIFRRITFLTEDIIPIEIWQKSARLVREVDMDDIAFVALSLYEEVKLWTGDKSLTNGLNAKGFDQCLSTAEILTLRKKLEK